MSNTKPGSLTAVFGGEEQTFRLAYGELFELQERTGCGPEYIANAIRDGSWHVQHVTETLRIGLIGGGTKPEMATNLVRRYVREMPDWLGNKTLAHAVLAASLLPPETQDDDDDEDDEDEPGKPIAVEAPQEDGTGNKSTQPPELPE